MSDLSIINIDTATLGDRSYIAHDGKTALVVDPQRDIDRIQTILEESGLSLAAVVETHMHNDYLSGGLTLAREYGASYITSAEDPVEFERTPARDLDLFTVGTFAIQALRTPGHTFTHLSYILKNASDQAEAIFTGGSLLHGSTGRPDLLGSENAPKLARAQHGSAHRIAELLDGEISIRPTHGFGSFCAATATSGDHSKLKDEKLSNPALLLDVEEFISTTLAGLDAFPAYYKYMGPGNLAGAPPIDLSELANISREAVRAALHSQEWVIDIRHRDTWAKEHLKGTVNFGIEGSFATYLGWLFPYERPLYLLSDSAQDISKAQRELVRIGIDQPTGVFVGDIGSLGESKEIKRVKFSDLPEALKDEKKVILDVRRNGERSASHILGSIHIPLHQLETRAVELPQRSEIWVHCAGAYRASIAVGILDRLGFEAILINESFEQALEVAELEIVFSGVDNSPVAPSDLKNSPHS
jgi:hydroxyacylglutathione hydrolase